MYLRVGDIDKHVSPEEVKKLILENSESIWEAEKSDKTIKDVNISVLKKYVKKANAMITLLRFRQQFLQEKISRHFLILSR